MTSWTSLSFGVFAFGMMPSVAVHGSTRRHHRDPANRLSAAGFRKALRLIRLASADRAGTHSNAPFAPQSQSFLRGRPKFFGRFPEKAKRGPQALQRLVESEVARWTPLLKAAGAVAQ